MTPLCLTTRFTYLPMLLLALQGCGDGVRVLPQSDADPTGYYINTGTASVDDGAGGTIDINDLQAMVNGSRIMMMSVTNELLYDGIITNVSGNSFTADFTIYTEGGQFLVPAKATASGTIITGSSITGTLNGSGVGSGVGSGTFNLLYATTNNEVAALPRIENVAGINTNWQAKVGGSAAAQELIIDNTGVLTEVDFSGGGIFSGCELAGNIMPISGSSLYSVSVALTSCGGGGGIRNGTYTGLATSRTDSTTDDTLVLAVTKVTTVADERYSMDADFK